MNDQQLASVFVCLLGTHTDLSWHELLAISPIKPTRISDHLALITGDIDPQILLKRSGGLVKIWKIIKKINNNISDSELEKILSEVLGKLGTDQETRQKINFAIAELGRTQKTKIDPIAIKKDLKALGIKSRFRTGPKTGLSAALLLHHKITELAVIEIQQNEAEDSIEGNAETGVDAQDSPQTWIGQTVAIQDIDNWTHRDRGRPFAERKRGLLPPKTARVMVNLSLPELKTGGLVYDPFCGSGTILMEALHMGYRVAGSDLDSTATRGTLNNLKWLAENYNIDQNNIKNIFTADATTTQLPFKPDAIITEPFLGKPKPNPAHIANIVRGLGKLYLGTFKNLHRQLPKNTPIVMVFPQFTGKNKTSLFEILIDKLEHFGYTTSSEPLFYARPGALVQRQIIKLKVK